MDNAIFFEEHLMMARLANFNYHLTTKMMLVNKD